MDQIQKKFRIMFIGGTWNETYNQPDEFNTGYTGIYDEIENKYNKDLDVLKLNHTYGKSSGLARKIIKALQPFASKLLFANGGYYPD